MKNSPLLSSKDLTTQPTNLSQFIIFLSFVISWFICISTRRKEVKEMPLKLISLLLYRKLIGSYFLGRKHKILTQISVSNYFINFTEKVVSGTTRLHLSISYTYSIKYFLLKLFGIFMNLKFFELEKKSQKSFNQFNTHTEK